MPVSTHYFGDDLATQALTGKSVRPLSLASADFDEDGMPDLVSGYATADGAGVISIHRGNVDALWPYGPALRNGTPPAFLPDARTVAVPEAPDFLGAGDFDADGHWDIVAAKAGGHALYLLRGDGHGRFAPPEKIDLAGAVTALATGEINRLDGLTDIVVGITGDNGSQVLVFESPQGALRGKPEIFPLASPAAGLALAHLTGTLANDLAIASGGEIVVIQGRDRRLSQGRAARDSVVAASVIHHHLPSNPIALATGNFTSGFEDLAALGDDGRLYLLEGPRTDRPVGDGRLELRTGGTVVAPPGVGRPDWLPEPGTGRRKGLLLRAEAPLPASIRSAPRDASRKLVAAHIAASVRDSLIVLDGAANRMHLVSNTGGKMETASFDLAEGAPAAVLAMRLHPHPLSDLVMLQTGSVEPMVSHAQTVGSFTVTNTLDSGAGSLRQAIIDADNAGGSSSIVFDIPNTDPNRNPATGVFTIAPLEGPGCGSLNGCEALPDISTTVTVDAYTQPGASPNTLAAGDNAHPLIQISGVNAGQGPNGFATFGTGGIPASATIRGFIVNGFQLFSSGSGQATGGGGINLYSPEASFIEGNFIGTDPTGTVAVPNSNGVAIFAGQGIVIGGTVPQARNLLSGNTLSGATNSANNDLTTNLLVQGNFIGADITGVHALANGGVFGQGLGMEGAIGAVGGTAAGAGNVISGNGPQNVALFSGATSVLVQGNLIGTDVTGTTSVGHIPAAGVYFASDMSTTNTVGGTTPAARNIISGNTTGVEVTDSADKSIVQGNWIGVDISGNLALPNGIGVHQDALRTTIGGDVPGAGNLIAGNTSYGVEFSDSTCCDVNAILGNSIGMNASGAALPNGGHGVYIHNGAAYTDVGGTDTTAANAIGFNLGDGVRIDSVYSYGQYNSVTGNAIFSNGGAGIRVVSGANETISRNSIYANGGLGIDLDVAGENANSSCNSANTGANGLQNAPVLTDAGGSTLVSVTATDPHGNTSEFSNCAAQTLSGNQLNISGTLNSAPFTTYTLEYFKNPSCDTSGFGQGKIFLGSSTVTTGANCTATFNPTLDLSKADLSVTLTYSGAPYPLQAYVSASITYTSVVTNNGAVTATGVLFTDPIPAGLAYASSTVNLGSCALTGTTLNCDLGTLPSGASATLTVTVTVTGPGTLVNTVTVSGAQTDPVPGNNSASVSAQSTYATPDPVSTIPVTATAGTGALALTIVGYSFGTPFTTVTFNGTPLAVNSISVFSSSGVLGGQCPISGSVPCQGLNVTVPANLLSSAGTATITITNPSPGGGSKSISFPIYPNAGATAKLLVAGYPSPTVSGVSHTFTVTAQDVNGATVTGYLGDIALTSSDFYFSQVVYQFVAADHGQHTFTSALFTAATQTIVATDIGTQRITGSQAIVVQPGPAALMVSYYSSTPQSTPIGVGYDKIIAEVLDGNYGNGVPNVTVTFTAPSSGASGVFSNGLTTISAVTDVNGEAVASFTANQTAGEFLVTATAGALSTTFDLTNTLNVPTQLLVLSGSSNQSATLHTQFANFLSVQVLDANNNPIRNALVTFGAPTSGASGAIGSGMIPGVADTTSVSVGPGVAGVVLVANGTPGTYSVTATLGALTATFTETNLNISPTLGGISVTGANSQSTTVNTQFPSPLKATPLDIFGHPIAGVTVTYSAPASGPSMTPVNLTAVSSALGVASVAVSANGIRGSYTATVSAGGFSDVYAMTNTPSTLNTIAATGGAVQTATIDAGFPAALQVTLLDPNGNPLNGQMVTFSAPGSGASAILSSQTAMTNSSGIASVQATANSLIGSYAVTASAPASMGSSNTITATFSLTNVGPPASVTAAGGTPQSAMLGAAFATPLQVMVLDSSANPLKGVSVNFTSPSSGAGANLSSSTAITNTAGIATVNATANTTAGGYTVTAKVGSLSATFALTNIQYPRCDVNQNGATNIVDVQRIVNEALGASAASDDLNLDGEVNVVDIQMVLNAGLGLGCTAK